jgi:hypothetical protein
MIISPRFLYLSATHAVPNIHAATSTYGGKLIIYAMATLYLESFRRMIGKK